jgi:5-methylcytosine-specific restriction endonuclease McrA
MKNFKTPIQMKITGRTSTMTHAFITSIISQIEPTDDQIRESLGILQMSPDNITCAYCGDFATEWGHLRPLVKDKKPTGFISEIHNLVPSCGKCNQSKGNKYWKDWINSKAKLSPKSRNTKNLDKLVERLEEYEKWSNAQAIDFEKVVDTALWNQHWSNRQKLFNLMKKKPGISYGDKASY